MKKFLSMVLALVMVMSLVTVSAGAKGFTDDSKVQYKEAVDVMSAVKVIDGYPDGSFNPQGTLTRGAAAKIICNLILGPTTASALSADTAPYKDVPVNHTFAGYIAYCQQQGIISGYADGSFRPGATLTNYAFMKMLLGALGYDADIEGYVGDNWSIAVAKRALNIGLTDDMVEEFVGTDYATREQACLYALNTMTADMVQYDSRTSVTVGGAEVVIAGSKAEVVKNTSKTDGNIFAEDGEMQFAEKYFTNLSVTKGSDDFARPANVWKVKSEKIGTYADKADVTYTGSVKSKDIYKDLDLGSTIAKADVEVYNNGVEAASIAIKKGSEDKIAAAGNGVLTEVFYNDDDDSVIVTSVQTYVGTINKSVAAKGDKDAYVEIAPESAPKGVSGILKFETNEEFEDDAYVLFTYSEDTDEVKSVAVAEEVSGTVTKAENSDTNVTDKKALTIDGERYKASANIAGQNLGDVTVKEDYTIYLDAYGYMIYVEENESTDYALVRAAADKGSFVGKKAELVFADGTSKVVETEKNYTSLVDEIVTYKVDDDGVYTLKAVNTTVAKANLSTFEMTNDKAGIKIDGDTTVTANSASVFVVGEEGKKIDDIDDYTAYTGIKNAPSIKTSAAENDQVNVYYYCKNGKMVTIMFVLPEENVEVTDGVSKTVFLAKESVSNLIHDADGDYFEYNAVVDDEITTVKVADDVTVDGKKLEVEGGDSYSKTVKKTLNGLYKSYSVDKYGIITDLKTYASDTFDGEKGYLVDEGIDKVSKEYTVLVGKNGSAYDYTITCDEDATYYYVDKDGEISESSYKALSQDDNDVVYLRAKDYMVQALFVEEVKAAAATYGVTIDSADRTYNYTVDGKKVTKAVTIEADEKGDDVDFTIEAVEGYQIDSVKAGSTTLKADKNGVYTVENVKSNVAVTVTVSKIPGETVNVAVYYVTTSGDKGTAVGTQAVKASAEAGVLGTVELTDVTIPAGYKYKSGLPATFTVGNGTPEVLVVVEKKSNQTQPSVAQESISNTGSNPSATATVNDSGISISVTNGSGDNNGDTITMKVTAAALGSCSPEQIILTYDGSNWTADVETVTGTAEDGTTKEYTVTVS
ncbi:S-layer homology domain-containing protein [uncultured Dysosmobacter sp.]|uniref:S-layer homology domain-containing protein n=1 Tax=uncultured Dysosmobacter sp. TaxID=2591384 RepID=UPI0026197C47|nr:S-layer homology domain-containing protein [uncultured Dysosmobacter sp.]